MILNKNKLLAVLVNYGDEQLNYLVEVVSGLKRFKYFEVTIIVQSNIPLDIEGIDTVNVITLEDYQLLPLTCRKVIWNNRNNYDVFLYGENDHLFLEKHVEKHLEYEKILPENRITGLIQFEENENGRYYPGYHHHFDWKYNSVETYKGLKFAHFFNTHQASFILSRAQLFKINKSFDFNSLVEDAPLSFMDKVLNKLKKTIKKPLKYPNNYSVKCKVNTDVYDYGGMKKLICISEFEDNLIHHLPNIYIDGLRGRNKFRSREDRMNNALKKLLKK
ncbi:hypothetical protein L3X37_11355 [Sabulilitoribacter arenilitoris]|uniref:Uncharacterized protein n=1 Tax=Wocania arenilitoris TaxID=2044858 RepID=A0AAE3ERB0_9FLAO|nr:hypothetical protein [Wocania arenilitoris]MCF7568954.1 hypothetical protein [Wocania arenilitoris]